MNDKGKTVRFQSDRTTNSKYSIGGNQQVIWKFLIDNIVTMKFYLGCKSLYIFQA